jgi:ATP-binding protein involved in chromosome partitioning
LGQIPLTNDIVNLSDQGKIAVALGEVETKKMYESIVRKIREVI